MNEVLPALRPQKLVGLLGTGAKDGHLDFHTAPEVLSFCGRYREAPCSFIQSWEASRTPLSLPQCALSRVNTLGRLSDDMHGCTKSVSTESTSHRSESVSLTFF